MESTRVQRWKEAQSGEKSYWQQVVVDPCELLRITHEKVVALRWAKQKVDALCQTEGAWVEIGIGPLGIGCIHFLPEAIQGDRRLIGIDPLPKMMVDRAAMPRPVQELADACRTDGYQHVVGRAEEIMLASESAALVVCYNVLDHTHSPRKVVREIERILRPGGYLLMGCDVLSVAALIKHRLRVALAAMFRHPLTSIGDVAHPHRIQAKGLQDLLITSGFEILATNARPYERIRRAWSHAYRMLIVTRKSTNAGRVNDNWEEGKPKTGVRG